MQKYSQSLCPDHPCLQKSVVNPRNGRKECVFVQIEAVYPDVSNPTAEYSFEELRARNCGYFEPDWEAKMKMEKTQWAAQKVIEKVHQPRQVLAVRNVQAQVPPVQPDLVDEIDLADRVEQSLMINDENAPPQIVGKQKIQIFDDENADIPRSRTAATISKKQKMQIFADENIDVPTSAVLSQSKVKTVPLRDENGASTAQRDRDAEIAQRARREERANRTRKVKVREVKRDDQTSKSPYFSL